VTSHLAVVLDAEAEVQHQVVLTTSRSEDFAMTTTFERGKRAGVQPEPRRLQVWLPWDEWIAQYDAWRLGEMRAAGLGDVFSTDGARLGSIHLTQPETGGEEEE
jgi:hypothetical protein